ncbi:cation diffusion facilitator family transporter [Pseudarthrobacter enclensis]|uniref:Cation diffusion facilitator family transporter n=1 Tax=Pseudarthrobacter enclensis TaxID=993070 RepID=A0A0V8IWJ9_9MICC|nr:cation transporter [Pseudarthrobacter enclensis]KSU79170.1 cation diffusion facilitator family transporter [Pseudarthrobacter enclensis]SCB83839.1 cation diffusion facilitator family transporter [Pseudarthrobacter enclensis]
MAASEERENSGSTLLTVSIAFAANALVAAAKSVAAFLTGSASMTAEAAHSWADTGNQVFLFLAERRSRRPRDRSHPMGYGREAYVWSMFAAVGLFTAGAVVSIMHGIQEIIAPEPASDFIVAYIVLAVAFVLEGISFTQAFRQTRRAARQLERRTLEQVLISSDPTLRAVFAEDAAALAGLVVAFAGVLLHQLTGSPLPDAVGSIVVGVLLAVVAVVLIDRNRRFLVGQGVTPDIRESVGRRVLEHRDIARLTYLHLEYVGPRKLYLVAAVDLQGDHPEHEVAVALRRIERELEDHETVEEAVLTLATPEESALVF